MKNSNPSDPHLDVFWRLDYLKDGQWYFRKFFSKAKAIEYVVKHNITNYTIREDNGSLLGGT